CPAAMPVIDGGIDLDLKVPSSERVRGRELDARDDSLRHGKAVAADWIAVGGDGILQRGQVADARQRVTRLEEAFVFELQDGEVDVIGDRRNPSRNLLRGLIRPNLDLAGVSAEGVVGEGLRALD